MKGTVLNFSVQTNEGVISGGEEKGDMPSRRLNGGYIGAHKASLFRYAIGLMIVGLLPYNGIKAEVIAGAIHSNRTIKAGAHQLTGSASLAPGATLTIEAGAIITASENASLDVGGTLIVQGTADMPVQFKGTGASTWQGIRFVNATNSIFTGVIISGARAAISLDGISRVEIRNNIFRNNQWAITDSHGYQALIVEKNTFENNISAMFGIRTDEESYIRFNEFINNQSVLENGYFFGATSVSNNNFLGNKSVIRAPEIGYGHGVVNIRSNYWGEISAEGIDKLIYDGYDNALLQKLNPSPVLNNPEQSAGADLSYERDISSLPRTKSYSSENVEKPSTFSIGIYRAAGGIVGQVFQQEAVHAIGYVFPQDADKNLLADLFVVMATPQGWFMRNLEGAFVPWDTRIASLAPAYEAIPLTNALPVNIYSGRIGVADSYKFYIGYMRLDEDELIYTYSAGKLEVRIP